MPDSYEITRNGIKDSDWSLERITSPEGFSAVKEFCCGDDDLDEFIRNDALAHKEHLVAETYLLREATTNAPVAFVSFCNDSIPLTQLQRKSKEKLPSKKRYPSLPAVKIARLGIREDLQRKSLGTHIINLSIVFFKTGNRTGCRFLTVDAYNRDNVLKFYAKNDFQCLRKQDDTKDTLIMYIDLMRIQN